MTDWDLLTPGIGLTSIGIVGVGISLAGIAKTFIDGMHAVSLLTMFIGMIFLASGLFKDGFPSTGKAKSATFITLGFLVTFGFAAAVTVSAQVPSIYAYIGLMLIISIPAAVLAVASFRQVPYLKALAVIFVSAAVVGGSTFYAFGLVTPKPPAPEEEEEAPAEEPAAPANVVNATILAGASAQGNPDYEPDPLSVNKGDGVQWTNEDNVPHTVTSRQESVFDSQLISAGEAWLLNTAEIDAAEYEYYCTLHPNMVGMLTVAEGGAAPAEGSGNATATENATGGAQNTTEGSSNQSSAGNQSAAGNQTLGAQGNGSGGATVTAVSIVVGASVPSNGEFYDPENVESSVGSMVTWTNDDSIPHTVTSGVVENNSPKPDGKFDSGILENGDSFPFVFDAAGEYPYYCTVHPFMTGKVIVN
ncbi:MAG TPA: plastocyanin/azurin family copper-binding protein [Nitrososphaera sp.]|nr:plastocyanin/azurin family copper-binding protein [Nitrososphaera sp.]